VLFVQFSKDQKPKVSVGVDGLKIEVVDQNLGENLVLKADLLALAPAILPYKDEKLAQFFKVP